MEFRKSHLEVSDTNAVISALSELFSPVINSIKFTNFISVSDFLEQGSDFVSCFKFSKVMLGNTLFRDIGWEKKINGLWLISVVLIISDALEFFVWDVLSDGWASE